MKPLALLGAVLAACLASGMLACGQTGAEPCAGFCPSNQIAIGAFGTAHGPGFTVNVSGPACRPSGVTCYGEAGAYESCRVAPSAAGVCHIEVDLAGGGHIVQDVTVTDYGNTCCGGLRPGESSIDVGAADAGSDG